MAAQTLLDSAESPEMCREEEFFAPKEIPDLITPLKRTLSGWEIVFFTLIVLLGTALIIDLWLLLN